MLNNKNLKNVEISASMMCVDWLNAGEQVRKLIDLGVDYLHWDIVDGRFAPDFTMGSSIIECFKDEFQIRSDYHLMVEEPSRLFNAFQIMPGDIFTIHQECSRNLHRDLINLRRRGARVGVALTPATTIESLEYIIEDIDVILIMTVNPGFKGQKLIPQMIRKIDRLKEMIDKMNLEIKISVDGNVNCEHVGEMVIAGADILVAGSSGLFRNDVTLANAWENLNKCIAVAK
jgi:ribulose-phosphate 3-epimerase